MKNHRILMVSGDGVIKKQLTAERVDLPYEDNSGYTDPQIGISKNGDIYVQILSRILKSSDQGRSWSLVTSLQYEGSSFTILEDDTFLLGFNYNESGIGKVYTIRSKDYGKTWERPVNLDITPHDRGVCGGGSGHAFTQMRDGTILFPVTVIDGQVWNILEVYRSIDNGKTWGDRSHICAFGGEAHLSLLRNDRVIAVVRYQRILKELLPSEQPPLRDKITYLADSDDKGYSWRNWRQVTTTKGDTPGELIELSDGRVVLLYCHRYPRFEGGTRAMVSNDQGQTWNNYIYLINQPKSSWMHAPKEVGRYSASIVTGNDGILTVRGYAIKLSLLEKNGTRKGKPVTDMSKSGIVLKGKAEAIRWRLE